MDGGGWAYADELKAELAVLRTYFIDLTIVAVGIANSIHAETATTAQQTAVRLLERFLMQIPPDLRAKGV